MTYKEWEHNLELLLGDMPKSEIDNVKKFYREIYIDKKDLGLSEAEIVAEFGSPKECAEGILSEQVFKEEYVGEVDILRTKKKKSEEKATRIKPSEVSKVLGLILLTLILYIPLFAVLFSLVVGFAAVCFSGAAAALAGICGTVIGFINALSVSFVEGVLLIGMGTAAIGAGVFVFIIFFYATKYSAIGLYKAIKLLIFK